MSLADIKARFLARTETVRVRIPTDPDAVERLDLQKQRRATMEADHAAAVARYKEGHKLADAPPEEPDYAEVDDAITVADREVDEGSIMVVLQWRPGVYQEAHNWGREKDERGQDRSWLEVNVRLAAGLYLRSEGYEDGAWSDLELDWADLYSRITDGELAAVGAAARQLCEASDAGPFVKRGKTSAAT